VAVTISRTEYNELVAAADCTLPKLEFHYTMRDALWVKP
jgi:hypothetical protein